MHPIKNEKLNIGFIGTGDFARKQRLTNAAVIPHINVRAICDINSEALSKGARLCPDAEFFNCHADLLTLDAVDAVVITTLPEKHFSLTCEAMLAGKHVYVEKPLSHNIADCLEVERIAAKQNRHVAVGFNRRFAPAFADMKNILAGDTGKMLMTYFMVDDFRDRSIQWRNRNRLQDECCHAFDALNWFAESPPAKVYATGSSEEEGAQVIITYQNGTSGTLTTSGEGAFHWPKERLEIICKHTVLSAVDFVELQAGGIPGWQDRRYAGCEYEGFSKGYADMYARLGLPFYRAMRSQMGDAMLTSGIIEDFPKEEKWSVFAKRFPQHIRVPINYSCDKGWREALAGFAESILNGEAPKNANAHDAALSVAVAQAATRSIESGKVETVKNFSGTEF